MKIFFSVALIFVLLACSSQSNEEIYTELEQLETQLNSLKTTFDQGKAMDFEEIDEWKTRVNSQVQLIKSPVSLKVGQAISRFNSLRLSLPLYDSLSGIILGRIDSARVNIELLKKDVQNSAGSEYLYPEYVTHERNNVNNLARLVERRDSLAVIIVEVHKELSPTLELNLTNNIEE